MAVGFDRRVGYALHVGSLEVNKLMSLEEWRRELKIFTFILIAVAIVEAGRRWLGFRTEKIDRIDVLLWIGAFALVQLGKLLLDCADVLLHELNQIRLQGVEDKPSLQLEIMRRFKDQKKEETIQAAVDELRNAKHGEKLSPDVR